MAEKEAKTSLSELPEDILHHIMSLLPTTLDVMAIGLSSKTLISVVNSFYLTSMDFHHSKLRYGTTKGFLKFMIYRIYALERRKIKTCPERFRLQAPLMLMVPDKRIEKAIGFVVRKGVKEIDIDARVFFDSGSCYRKSLYHLPVHVMVTTHPTNSITTLNFKGLCIPEGLNEVIRACPQIENVDLTSCSVPSNTRFSSKTLKNIHIAHCWVTQEFGELTIAVDSPNLQNFVLAVGMSDHKRIPIRFLRKSNFLKVLSLEKAAISDQWVKAYVSELVHLETLTLKQCGDFDNFKVSNHHKLRTIELIRCSISHSIEIGVLHLESFTAHNISYPFRDVEFDMNACKHLKSLELCDYSLTQEFLEMEISRMTSIESLILDVSFSLFPITKICHPNITSLELLNYSNYRIEQIHVDTPRLVSFIHNGHIIPLRVDCSEPLLEATMSTSSDRDPNFKLRTWFEFFGHCKTATLVCRSYKDFTLPRKLRKKFTAPLSGLKRLTLEIGKCSWSRISRDLIENLLWLYPDLEALNIEWYKSTKERTRYAINVPCHDRKLLAAFLETNTNY